MKKNVEPKDKVAMTLLTSYFVSKQEKLKDTNDAFLSLSKGKCQNNCPVYDLWIFENGQVIYKGIENVVKMGVHTTTISTDVVRKMNDFILNSNSRDIGDAKGRDNPLTIIKFNNKKIVFQSQRAKGNLLELNNLLEHIASVINENND